MSVCPVSVCPCVRVSGVHVSGVRVYVFPCVQGPSFHVSVCPVHGVCLSVCPFVRLSEY